MAKELEAQKTPVAGQMAGNMAASPNKATAEDTLNLPMHPKPESSLQGQNGQLQCVKHDLRECCVVKSDIPPCQT